MLLYTLDDFAADVEAFMDGLEIEEATLAGHSGGTLISPCVALSYPSRVSRLVLIGSAVTWTYNEVMSELIGETVRTVEDPTPLDFVRELHESTIHNQLPEEFLDKVISESLKLPARYDAILWRV